MRSGIAWSFSAGAEIERAYGSAGIRLAVCDGPLVVSDDTQMTLFTLEGMARAASVEEITAEVREAYLDWLGTQRTQRGRVRRVGGSRRHAVMQQPQAPGTPASRRCGKAGRGRSSIRSTTARAVAA